MNIKVRWSVAFIFFVTMVHMQTIPSFLIWPLSSFIVYATFAIVALPVSQQSTRAACDRLQKLGGAQGAEMAQKRSE